MKYLEGGKPPPDPDQDLKNNFYSSAHKSASVDDRRYPSWNDCSQVLNYHALPMVWIPVSSQHFAGAKYSLTSQ